MNQYPRDTYYEKVRNIAMCVGFGMIACSTYSKELLPSNINIQQSRGVLFAAGVTIIVLPLVRQFQDLRDRQNPTTTFDDKNDPDDDEGGGGWHFDDDTPPIVPDSPGGLTIDWVSEVELYANKESEVLVDV